MNIIKKIVEELVGLFVDDGSLALHLVILIAVLAGLVKLLGLPPLIGAFALLIGCLAILSISLRNKARGK